MAGRPLGHEGRLSRHALEAVADPARGAAMSAYLRGRFPCLGVPQPARRAATVPLLRGFVAAAPHQQVVLEAAVVLWHEPPREFAYVACDLLTAARRLLTPQALTMLEDLLRSRSWWDSVDALTGAAVNPLCRRHPAARQRMDDWALDPSSFWVRRAAIIHQLGWKADVDRDRLARHVDANADHPEFFVRKAIGWALRDAARTHPDWVRGFVADRQGVLSPLSVREATRHLSGDAAPRQRAR